MNLEIGSGYPRDPNFLCEVWGVGGGGVEEGVNNSHNSHLHFDNSTQGQTGYFRRGTPTISDPNPRVLPRPLPLSGSPKYPIVADRANHFTQDSYFSCIIIIAREVPTDNY